MIKASHWGQTDYFTFFAENDLPTLFYSIRDIYFNTTGDKIMRCARIKAEGTGYYHIMSRAIEGRFIFGNSEKEKFRKNMRNLASFCGLNILTYSIMSSHWHILLEVPERREISDAELIRRLGFIYDDTHVEMIRSELSRTRQSGDHDGA
jgi:hypothetical protein